MFSMVGRFRFGSLDDTEQQSLIERMEHGAAPILRECNGFRELRVVYRPEDNELMTVWLWESAEDWDAALAKLGPWIQENLAPNLTQPPERLGGEIAAEFTPEALLQS